MNNTALPDDLRHLLGADPRIVDIHAAKVGRRRYAMQEWPAESRPAGWICEAMARELEGKATLPEHRYVWSEEPVWLGEVEPLANPVLIAGELKDRFPEADAHSPRFVVLRAVAPSEMGAALAHKEPGD